MVYSLASPRRTHPKTGVAYSSVLKPIGEPFTNKTVDFHTGVVSDISIQPVDKDEDIQNTIAVMGGEDWKFWIEDLKMPVYWQKVLKLLLTLILVLN